eukprot:TRINITY_DN8627_c0_g1_i1.p1 TRINITY_DN8627_c0_g1~~TRINITY_DN8627_c0_g1_i1.p1  ORF type:complete len:686 (+),score=239.49 TRINITY_DN8627_c0_g1_i1:80-2059(+)
MRPARSCMGLLAWAAAAAAVPALFEGGSCEVDEDAAACTQLKGREKGLEEACCVPPHPPADRSLNTCGGTRPTGLPFAGRSPVYAQHGMAATSVPLSTMCAIDVLKRGGSAVDGAIAANACEGVVEPMMNGMGGDLMAMVWDPTQRKLHGYNGAGRSPRGLSAAELEQELRKQRTKYIPGDGPLGVSVPGAVKGWCDLHERFGKLQWSQLFESAIGYARHGHPVAQVIAAEWYIPRNTSALTSGGEFPRALDGFMQTFTVPDGAGGRRTPRAGEVFRNPALADTLEKVAAGGCEEFYNGSVARAYAEYAKESGLRLTEEDFAKHHGEWVDPLNSTYREEYMVFELPPNPQGVAALQMLNILEHFNLSAMGHNTADYLHAHVEAKKLAFADRAKFYGDPDFGAPTRDQLEWLISKSYAAERVKLLNMSRAARRVDPGTPPSERARGFPSTAAAQDKPHTGDTIYLTVADGEGMMVSLIQSNYQGFGSGLVVPSLGFGLQDRGSLFNLPALTGVRTASDYAPGKRPFHTIIPGFAMRRGAQGAWEPWMSFGVMGGNIQPQGHAQILCNIIDFGMNPQEAGDAARYTHSGSSQPTGQVMTDGGYVQLEQGVCQGAYAELQRRGHALVRGANGGGYQSITVNPATGVYVGATEMRKDGIAAGW